MEKRDESGELDLTVSKQSLEKERIGFKNNESDQNDTSMCTSLGPLLSSNASLESQTIIPLRSSISSLLSLNHLRLWENPITASAISAAAAMTHLMDINNCSFASHYGGKSSEEQANVSRNMCTICGRVARDQSELEHHMLTHAMDKSYQCVKYGLSHNRMQGLLAASKKKKKCKELADTNDDEPLDVTMPDVKKKRIDSLINNNLYDSKQANCDDIKNKSKSDSNDDKSVNSINTTAFPCTSCHKTFATEVDLKAHLMRHLTQHPFVCFACGKGFKYEHSLNFHIKSYHSSGINESNAKNLIINSNTEHEKKQSDSFKLNECQKNYDINQSQSDSTPERDYDAETSIDEESDDEDNNNDNNNKSKNINNNYNNDTEEEENRDKNDSIDYGAPANFAARSIKIKSEKVLLTLLEGVHPITEQSYILYKCCLCGFAFPSLEPVTLHLQTSHLSGNKEFTCDKCGANFKWRSELNLHEQLHKAMNHNDQNGQLSIAPFMQPNLVLMNSELGSSLSPTQLSVSDNNNNNSSKNNNNDNNNNNNNNKGNEYNNCDKNVINNSVCNNKSDQSGFSDDVTENKHISHKSFPKHKSSSEANMKTDNFNLSSQKFPVAIGDIEETAPGQFKCRFCDKTFDRIFSVHRHERVHTGFKPCICKTCGRGFSEKRNLRHHIIRFHSDGSGRELLKRNRKEKANSEVNNKRKMATTLKKAALKILNNGIESAEKNNSEDNNENKKSTESNKNTESNKEENNNCTDSSLNDKPSIDNAQTAPQSHPPSSSRRRKGKPSKKIITTEELSPASSLSTGGENNENHDNDNEETQYSDKSRDDADTNSDINPNDFLETKFRCHGAFFSSYNPRLGVVDKPVKRNEACRPLLGPDGKFLYPCTYCSKTFCSLSDLNRHMNFHEDVRPFKCEYCNYQSRTNSQLKVHMMRHAGIKQYLCQVCNYNGVTQSDLNRHCKTRSHALRSANICPMCALGFSTRTLLDDHIIKFHEASESLNSSHKSCSKADKPIPEHNNNDYSSSAKSFSVKQILN